MPRLKELAEAAETTLANLQQFGGEVLEEDYEVLWDLILAVQEL